MKRKRYSEQQIVKILKDAEAGVHYICFDLGHAGEAHFARTFGGR